MGIFKKDPLQIIPFRTYGTDGHLYLKGRALEDEDIDLSQKGWFNLLVNSWKQFETDEIRHCDLQLEVANGSHYRITTDAEGYYLLDNAADSLTELKDSDGWVNYTIGYDNYKGQHPINMNNSFTGQMLIPNENAQFGVISDIDDTILHTGVTSRLKWKVAVNTFFRSPEKRRALEGSSEFYNLLHSISKNGISNPIFYVSNSPWNLYRYLEYFLRVNEFPHGPLLLRDFRTPFDRTPKMELAHKYHEIFNILKTYPKLPFILIGDCGEKDPYIYLDVVKKYPEQIAGIYLRSVTHSKKMKQVTDQLRDCSKVPCLIVENTNEAIAHAKANGFID